MNKIVAILFLLVPATCFSLSVVDMSRLEKYRTATSFETETGQRVSVKLDPPTGRILELTFSNGDQFYAVPAKLLSSISTPDLGLISFVRLADKKGVGYELRLVHCDWCPTDDAGLKSWSEVAFVFRENEPLERVLSRWVNDELVNEHESHEWPKKSSEN